MVPFNIELLSLACRGCASRQAAYKLGSDQWFLLFPARLRESNSDALESVTRHWKQTKPQILPQQLSSALCPKAELLSFLSSEGEKEKQNTKAIFKCAHAGEVVIEHVTTDVAEF